MSLTWTAVPVMKRNTSKSEKSPWQMNAEAGLGMEVGLYVEVALGTLRGGCEWN